MNSQKPWWARSLSDAVDAVASGKIHARALAEALLTRIDVGDASIEAWAHLDRTHVRRAADACDLERTSRPLRGLGVGVKDIVGTADLPTELGTPIVARRPVGDAECIVRLKRAGGYVFGKTVTTPFAFLDPGKTRNPWNSTHTPGGSSSGSAAAVASGQVAGAIGTQTNGSVIRPAAYCGVVGFKPTQGHLPFTGVHVFSDTLDQLGVFTRSVADAARLAAPLAEPGKLASQVDIPTRAPRIAYLGGFPWVTLDCDADDTLEAAVTGLRGQGALVVPVDLPRAWHGARDIHRTIMLFEAARNLGAVQATERERLSPELNAALDAGRSIAREAYDEALAARARATTELARWLADYDAIIAPAAPSTAPAGLGSTGDPSCCTLWSLTGFPAIAIPVGLCAGLPVGMQLAAPPGHDDRLLGVAAWCEARLGFKGLV